jgi:tetratricopeptide (TPR) repeat protein
LLALAFGIALLLAPPAAYADFAQGVRAYEAGDHKGAFEAWLPLAERGDVAAMRNIGHLYRWGQGVEKDIQQAMHWYRKAAETGFARAQANLAAIYLQGDEGVPIDHAEARKWFEAAARQGHAVAQYNLGLMYELGLGVEKNDAIALGWYNNAAKAGQPDALERLSLLVMRRGDAPVENAGAGGSQPKAASADNGTENAGGIATEATPGMVPAPPAPPATVPAAAAPAETAPAAVTAAEPPVAAPLAEPATTAATVAAPAPAQTAADAPPASPPKDEGIPWLVGRFFSAISSGGGVSIPDIFESAPQPSGVEAENGRKDETAETRP